MIPIGHYKEALDQIREKAPLIRKLFQKYPIPLDKQKKAFQFLVIGYRLKLVEKANLHYKFSARKEAVKIPVDLHKLKKAVSMLLKNLPDTNPELLLTKKNKNLCESVIKQAIAMQSGINALYKNIEKHTNRRTIVKFHKNPKDLKAYTDLIKHLARLLNPVFRDKIKDKWLPRNRIEETTFQIVADILNIVFPKLNFTPEQVKSRYHKNLPI